MTVLQEKREVISRMLLEYKGFGVISAVSRDEKIYIGHNAPVSDELRERFIEAAAPYEIVWREDPGAIACTN